MASGTIKSVVPRSDIVDNLTTNDSTKVLSAAQGKALADQAANKPDFVSLGSLQGSSMTLTFANGTYALITVHGAAVARTALYLVRTTSSTVYVFPIHDETKSTTMSVTTDGRNATITNSISSGACNVFAIVFSGSITKNT